MTYFALFSPEMRKKLSNGFNQLRSIFANFAIFAQ